MPAVPPTAALRTRLSSHLAMGNFEALRDHLAALRTAEFRAAGVVLAEANFWSPLTDKAFWAAFAPCVAPTAELFSARCSKPPSVDGNARIAFWRRRF